ncbi:cysteine hydrolase family protein [Hirschia baltica]|uniref:Isochorismatase hydrolase n=1 Tax=Hirschia baltica (strain ATCC 49814 / DSM 5838 / IFAM 1418) TaxID=582402 RepID=C6XRL3_HIRBI|nr:cysteine hydrolase family protein [Hirschia baltica]ACT60623.1 isochorismatase hydrolase [Hirschia baltica ATCC 49814]
MYIDKNAAFVVLDVQKAIDLPVWGVRNNPDAEAKMSHLLRAWRQTSRPVFHVRHDSNEVGSGYRPDSPTHAFKEDVLPLAGETIIGKNTHSAFVGTGFDVMLRSQGIEQVFLCGVKTNNSIETSVRHGANLGLNILLIEDACFTHNQTDWNGVERSAEEVHAMSLANLAGEYCQIVSAQLVLDSLL